MTTLTEQDVARNMRAVDHAIAQQELEGLKVPQSTVDDLRRAARGEIRSEDVIRNIYGLISHTCKRRTIDISKGGHLFAHHAHIGSAAATIFQKLADERGQQPSCQYDRWVHP